MANPFVFRSCSVLREKLSRDAVTSPRRTRKRIREIGGEPSSSRRTSQDREKRWRTRRRCRVHTWTEINDNREKRAAFTLRTRGREKQISSHTNETMHGEITSGGPFPKRRTSGRKRVGVRRGKIREEGEPGTEERGNRATVGAVAAARFALSIK